MSYSMIFGNILLKDFLMFGNIQEAIVPNKSVILNA